MEILVSYVQNPARIRFYKNYSVLLLPVLELTLVTKNDQNHDKLSSLECMQAIAINIILTTEAVKVDRLFFLPSTPYPIRLGKTIDYTYTMYVLMIL